MAEKSLTMVLRARDEATQKMRDQAAKIRKTMMSAVGPFVAIGAIITTASKAAAAGAPPDGSVDKFH